MSTVRAYDLDAAYASAKGENADLKICQARDLLAEINALDFSLLNLSNKQIAGDIYQNVRDKYVNWLWEKIMRDKCLRWQHQFGCNSANCKSFHEENYMHHVEPNQDEVIRNLKYKLLHKSNSLAEEKKLIKHIKEAEEFRDTPVANPKRVVHRMYDTKETNTDLIHLAKQQKMMHVKKVLDDLDSAGYHLSSFEKVEILRMKKRYKFAKSYVTWLKLLNQKDKNS